MMQKKVSHFHAFVGKAVLEWILSLMYVLGLTMLFPLIYFRTFNSGDAPTILGISIGLMIVSFFGFLFLKSRLSSTCIALSKITLIPGIIGFIFSVFSGELFYEVVSRAVPEQAVMLLKLYIEEAVPKVRALTITYLAIGVFLWWMGQKTKKQ